MNKNKFKNLALSMTAATMFFTGCATTELQTNVKMTQSVFINPVRQDLKTIFVRTQNTSGQNINLEKAILDALMAKGYRVVDDPDMATYVLMMNVLYCDEKQENNASGGALGAGALGAGISAYNSHGATQPIAVGLGSALIGGLVGKALEDTIYQMQVDIVIREKAKGEVFSSSGSVQGQSSVRDTQRAGFVNSFGGNIGNVNATGHLNSNMANTTNQNFATDYIEHKTMLFAEATKMNLSLEEATPILEKQISNQIAGLF